MPAIQTYFSRAPSGINCTLKNVQIVIAIQDLERVRGIVLINIDHYSSNTSACHAEVFGGNILKKKKRLDILCSYVLANRWWFHEKHGTECTCESAAERERVCHAQTLWGNMFESIKVKTLAFTIDADHMKIMTKKDVSWNKPNGQGPPAMT